MNTNDDSHVDQAIAELQTYSQHCDFFNVEKHSSDPRGILITFKGKFIQGVTTRNIDSVEPEYCDSQQVELCLSESFPQVAPLVFWKSKIFHPNIPLGGSLKLTDVGLNWDAEMTLVVVCERLWDVARLAFLDATDPANSTAGNWFAHKIKVPLPLDNRRLEKPQSQKLNNVFCYRRKGAGITDPPPTTQPSTRKPPIAQAGDGIVFID